MMRRELSCFLVICFALHVQGNLITTSDLQLKSDLIEQYGEKLFIYQDQLARKRLGVGHIVKGYEREYKMNPGTPVAQLICEQRLRMDLFVNLAFCRKQTVFQSFESLPEDIQRLVIVLMFDMNVLDFVKDFVPFRAAIDSRDWSKAAALLDEHPIWKTRNPQMIAKLAERLRKHDSPASSPLSEVAEAAEQISVLLTTTPTESLSPTVPTTNESENGDEELLNVLSGSGSGC